MRPIGAPGVRTEGVSCGSRHLTATRRSDYFRTFFCTFQIHEIASYLFVFFLEHANFMFAASVLFLNFLSTFFVLFWNFPGTTFCHLVLFDTFLELLKFSNR